MLNEYENFINSKKHKIEKFGIDVNYMPDILFDYQKHVAEYAINKGKCAVFLDTGLGKTFIELVIAINYIKHTNKPVLIITPLAVAYQFLKEAEKLEISDIEYSKDGSYKSKIVVCNYERIDKFNNNDFDCVILDESSILKNFDGKIKAKITNFIKRVKYRYLFTATPSPNDFIELGTSSEALGYLGYMDMLGKFFSNKENNFRPQDIGSKFYLKPHAEKSFFEWVSTWSISMRKPSDLGFSDDRHILPNLNLRYNNVKNKSNWVLDDGQILAFNIVARRMSEVRIEQKMTIKERCEKAIEISNNHDKSVYWCNFNDEGDLLQELDKEAYQIKGSMNIDKKEDILLNFYEGNINKLITKPKITAFGLNWQHCNHTVYFPTFSYEQFYQAIRRFYRFGQKREVFVDLVFSDGQKRVLDTLMLKSKKADNLFTMLNNNINRDYEVKQKEFNNELILPKFIKEVSNG
jgi:SNF2 family DNA or RNA helicase